MQKVNKEDFMSIVIIGGHDRMVGQYKKICKQDVYKRQAMGAIKREMNNAKWFWFAVGYQTLLAYVAVSYTHLPDSFQRIHLFS